MDVSSLLVASSVTVGVVGLVGAYAIAQGRRNARPGSLKRLVVVLLVCEAVAIGVSEAISGAPLLTVTVLAAGSLAICLRLAVESRREGKLRSAILGPLILGALSAVVGLGAVVMYWGLP